VWWLSFEHTKKTIFTQTAKAKREKLKSHQHAQARRWLFICL